MNAATLPLYALPAIGAPWPGQGGTFAGLVRDAVGGTCALILADDKADAPLTWSKAKAWAKKVRTDGHKDFTLPNRAEARVLWVNLRESFEPQWHWLSEEYDGSSAWGQFFDDGDQDCGPKSYEGQARAVRSFILQSFDASTGAAP